MIETPLPLAPELYALVPPYDLTSLLEQLATLQRETATLCAETAAL